MTEAEFQGEANEGRKKLNFLDDMTVTVSAHWLDVFWTCNVWNLCFLLLEPPSHEAGPQAFIRCLLCVALHSPKPDGRPFFTKAHSNFASGQLHLPQSRQSRQIKHVRWHTEEKSYWLIKAFFMARSYFSWPATCSQVLITFQPTAAIYSNILGPQMFACMCLSVCVHVWIRLESCSKAVGCKVRTKGKS